MSVRHRQEARERRYFERGRCSVDSESSSSSKSEQHTNTTTTTNNVDRRQVIDNGAIGVTTDQGVTINALDQGAVAAALDLAGRVDASSSANYKALLDNTAHVFNDALKVLDKNTSLASEVSSSIASAYDVAQSSVSGARDQQKTLLIIGAVVLGFIVFKR